MSRLSFIACALVLLAGSLACEGAGRERERKAGMDDAGRRAPRDATAMDADAVHHPNDASDASVADAGSSSSELNAQLIEFLREIEREGAARCPCRIEAGEFSSPEACVDAVSFKEGWEQCAMLVPVPDGNAEALQCALSELRRRNACLAPAPCASETLTRCRAASINCPELDAEVLSRVLVWCRGMLMFFH